MSKTTDPDLLEFEEPPKLTDQQLATNVRQALYDLQRAIIEARNAGLEVHCANENKIFAREPEALTVAIRRVSVY